MQPGERVEVIKRISTRLGAEDEWSEVDLVLEQFGFETEYRWEGDVKSYVIHCVKSDADAKLRALDQFLMGHSRPDEEPWEDGRFRLFITHLAKHKVKAHALKSNLRFYGIDAFVAHDDIRPGTRAQAERLRTAEKGNPQLSAAFDFDKNLSSIEAKIAVADPLPRTYDDEPF